MVLNDYHWYGGGVLQGIHLDPYGLRLIPYTDTVYRRIGIPVYQNNISFSSAEMSHVQLQVSDCQYILSCQQSTSSNCSSINNKTLLHTCSAVGNLTNIPHQIQAYAAYHYNFLTASLRL